MPTEAARAAFAEAQKHSAQMHDIHVQELELQLMLARSASLGEKENLLVRMTELHAQWLAESAAYSAAMARFSQEVARRRTEIL